MVAWRPGLCGLDHRTMRLVAQLGNIASQGLELAGAGVVVL
jgi:hypothetical protein